MAVLNSCFQNGGYAEAVGIEINLLGMCRKCDVLFDLTVLVSKNTAEWCLFLLPIINPNWLSDYL